MQLMLGIVLRIQIKPVYGKDEPLLRKLARNQLDKSHNFVRFAGAPSKKPWLLITIT